MNKTLTCDFIERDHYTINFISSFLKRYILNSIKKVLSN